MRRRSRFFIAVVALAAAGTAAAGEPVAWRKLDAASGRISDIDDLTQLAEDFPDSTSVRRRLLMAQLQQGLIDAALDTLAWLKVRGYVFGDGAQEQIPLMLGERGAEGRALLLDKPTSIATSRVVGEVPSQAGLVESVFAPGPDGLFVVTSVSERAIFVSNAEGQWLRVEFPGADDLSGIVSDVDRNIGWIASSNIDQSTDTEVRFNGVFGTTGDAEALVRLRAPERASVSDLTVAPDGTVFASDPLQGGLYRSVEGSNALQELVAPGTLRSPQGIAVSTDGLRLYVSDYNYGIALVEIATGEVSRLASDVPVILDGIDGLWRRDRELIAVQNGISPMRIVGLQLSDEGDRIVGSRIIEQANPDWTEPLSGNLDGDSLVYVGNGQWDRYEQGKLIEGKTASPIQIRRLPLD